MAVTARVDTTSPSGAHLGVAVTGPSETPKVLFFPWPFFFIPLGVGAEI